MKIKKLYCLFLLVVLAVAFSSTALWAATAVGRFTRVEGTVDVLRGGAMPAQAVMVGAEVFQSDIIRTKSNSRAEVLFKDKNVIKIAPRSRIDISEYSLEDKGSRVIKNARGMVGADVPKENTDKIKSSDGAYKFEIHTATAVAGVRGTTFYSMVGSDGVTHISCMAGTVYVASGGTMVEVPAGYTIDVRPDGTKSAPRPMTDAEKNQINSQVSGNRPPEQQGSQQIVTETPNSITDVVMPPPVTETAGDTALVVVPTTTVLPAGGGVAVPPPTLTMSGFAASPVIGSATANFTITLGGATSYDYSLNGGATQTSTTGTITLTNLAPGPYTLTYSGANTGGSTAGTYNFLVIAQQLTGLFGNSASPTPLASVTGGGAEIYINSDGSAFTLNPMYLSYIMDYGYPAQAYLGTLSTPVARSYQLQVPSGLTSTNYPAVISFLMNEPILGATSPSAPSSVWMGMGLIKIDAAGNATIRTLDYGNAVTTGPVAISGTTLTVDPATMVKQTPLMMGSSFYQGKSTAINYLPNLVMDTFGYGLTAPFTPGSDINNLGMNVNSSVTPNTVAPLPNTPTLMTGWSDYWDFVLSGTTYAGSKEFAGRSVLTSNGSVARAMDAGWFVDWSTGQLGMAMNNQDGTIYPSAGAVELSGTWNAPVMLWNSPALSTTGFSETTRYDSRTFPSTAGQVSANAMSMERTSVQIPNITPAGQLEKIGYFSGGVSGLYSSAPPANWSADTGPNQLFGFGILGNSWNQNLNSGSAVFYFADGAGTNNYLGTFMPPSTTPSTTPPPQTSIVSPPITGIGAGKVAGVYDATSWNAGIAGAWVETSQFISMASTPAGQATLQQMGIPAIEVGRANLSGSNGFTGWWLQVNMPNTIFYAPTGTGPVAVFANNSVSGSYDWLSAPNTSTPISGNGLSGTFQLVNYSTTPSNFWTATVYGSGTYTGTGWLNGRPVTFTGAAAGSGTGAWGAGGSFTGTAGGIAR